ncbi:hypothetical protein BWZ20_10925 [Winogradskyella sp. J14-2]|uniref:hypothetical protein n=1 Tax=Winogradskyella sp. J14-2 TaxID=1936080 RepID=UPI0009729B75|nr:hypothetical protein [Winogradskyella sp. J14-2]APY08783.1 hypothetical protein BWZ20_10925 [Winogradskyella sp. J14-2]
MSMFYNYDLGGAKIFIFDEFLVNQIEEGETVTPKDNEILRKIIDRHFSNKPVIYISNRHFSYSVDPLTYLTTSKIHNLLAIAIVTDKPVARDNAQFESNFYSKPFKIFDTLSQAMEWVHKVILEEYEG